MGRRINKSSRELALTSAFLKPMPVPVSLSFSHSKMANNPSNIKGFGHKHSRPQGLWKVRTSGTPRLAAKIDKPLREQHIDLAVHNAASIRNDDGNDSDTSFSSSSSSSRKRRRLSPDTDTPSSSDCEPENYFWNTAHQCTPERPSFIRRRSNKTMNITTTASGSIPEGRANCSLDDWEDLKELFARAQESYDSAEPAETLPLLRGVIHECHQFLLFYEDPSVLFATPPQPPTPPPVVKRDWSGDRYDNPYHKIPSDRVIPNTVYRSIHYPHSQDQKCKCLELPTAFHCILGTSLFYFGNLIGQNASLALEGEPNTSVPYWLATLDVFETGENIPSRTSGRGCDAPEDWRMAILWGRTLVSIAEEMVRRSAELNANSADVQVSATSMFSADEPAWPNESPFSAIAMRRPPVTRRMSFSSATPQDLLVLAMDQFSRGIFHMPHPKKLNHWQMKHESSRDPAVPPVAKPSRPSTTSTPINKQIPFSRSKELFTIASEVLLLAEKLELPSERKQWASFADSVFGQMKLEGVSYVLAKPEAEATSSASAGVTANVEDVDILARARGRCWLIVGSAYAEGLEGALERGELTVLETEDAEDARDALQSAIDYFTKARGRKEESEQEEIEDRDEDDDDDLPALLAEAYVTLANLTADVKRRDELYALAEKECGPTLGLAGDEPMNID